MTLIFVNPETNEAMIPTAGDRVPKGWRVTDSRHLLFRAIVTKDPSARAHIESIGGTLLESMNAWHPDKCRSEFFGGAS